MAGLITANFEPHKVALVPGVFLVLFVPIVLLPIHDKRQGEQLKHATERSPMSKISVEKWVKLLWVVGTCLWCSMIPLLWWHGYEAQTAAQASLNSTRLLFVSGIGGLWSLAGAAWLAKLRKDAKDLRAGASR